MTRRTLFFGLALFTLGLCAYWLVTGAPLLMAPLFGNPNFPAGTLVTWIGLAAFPLTLRLGIRPLDRPTEPFRSYRVMLNGILLLALAWGFVSYALAGNWSFQFSMRAEGWQGSVEAAAYFWYYSYAVAGLPLLWGVVYGGHMLIRRGR